PPRLVAVDSWPQSPSATGAPPGAGSVTAVPFRVADDTLALTLGALLERASWADALTDESSSSPPKMLTSWITDLADRPESLSATGLGQGPVEPADESQLEAPTAESPGIDAAGVADAAPPAGTTSTACELRVPDAADADEAPMATQTIVIAVTTLPR